MKKVCKFFKFNFSEFASSKKAYIVFFIIAFLIYGKSLSNGFVWDDSTAIVESVQMQKYTFSNIFGPSIYNDGIFYRPISALYFATQHLFFGDNAPYYHLTQLTVHIIVTSFIFILFKKFFSSEVAFFLSLVFLVHPINTEAISFISGGQAIVYSFFGMLSLLVFTSKNINLTNLILTILLLPMALLAKEEAIQYVVLINIYCLLFRKENFKYMFLISIISGLTYIVFRLSFAQDNFHIYDSFFNKLKGDLESLPLAILRLSPEQKILNIPLVIFYYIRTFFFPSKLAVQQIWAATEFDVKIFAYPVALITILLFGIVLYGIKLLESRKDSFRGFLFFTIWFLIGLLTHLPVFQAFDMTVADRWFYFPAIGLLGLLGFFYTNSMKSINPKLIGFLVILLFVPLSIRSHVRSLNFHDSITLFEHDSRVYNNSLIEQNLGSFYSENNDMKPAIEHAVKSVQLFPSNLNLLNLAVILEKAGYAEGAGTFFQRAYEMPSYFYTDDVKSENTYFFYSSYLIRRDKITEGRDLAEIGLKHYPDSERLNFIFGFSQYKLGLKTEALKYIGYALALAPDNDDYADAYKAIENKQKPINPYGYKIN